MNELLQQHGCTNVFTIPDGLKELMADISREVLRDQPVKIYDYIANYLSVLLITREHGILAVKILDELCDCKPTVSEHLMQLGLEMNQVKDLAQIIKEDIEEFAPVSGKETLKETQILKKILKSVALDEDKTVSVLQVVRNAYRDYWYRKMLLEKNMKMQPDEPWEIAAERTLNIYKRTKPSFSELNRATKKIQAAYRGYHVRRNILHHLKLRKPGPKVDYTGPPLDIAGSREIDLGPVVELKVREEDTRPMFDEMSSKKLGLSYDPMKTIAHDESAEKSRTFRFAVHDKQEQSSAGKKSSSESPSSDNEEHSEHQEKSSSQEEEELKISVTKFAPVPVSIIDDIAEVPEELPDEFEIADELEVPEEIAQFLDADDDFDDDVDDADKEVQSDASSPRNDEDDE